MGKNLKGGEVIELRSDLGGGKTTFVRGLAAGAGSKANVTSPTFTLSRIYPARDFDINHFDFYRLDDPGILSDQLAEEVGDKKAVVVVEWADIVNEVLPKGHISVEFSPTLSDPDERRITISYPQDFQPVIAKIGTQWDEVRP